MAVPVSTVLDGFSAHAQQALPDQCVKSISTNVTPLHAAMVLRVKIKSMDLNASVRLKSLARVAKVRDINRKLIFQYQRYCLMALHYDKSHHHNQVIL